METNNLTRLFSASPLKEARPKPWFLDLGALLKLAGPRLLSALPAALGLLAAGLVVLANAEYGPGGHWDSIVYLRHLRQLDLGQLPLPPTPPGFAALCWLGYSVFGLSPIAAAGAVNTVAFGLTVFVATFWLRSLGCAHWIVLWCGAVCILSPLAAISGDVMSEAPFILLVTLTLFSLDRFGTGRKWFLMLAVIGAAGACLTRLVGVAVLATGAILLFVSENKALATRIRDAVVFAVAAGAPVAAWALSQADVWASTPRQRYFHAPMSSLAAVETLVGWTFDRSGLGWTNLSSPWSSAATKLALLVVPLAAAALPALCFRRDACDDVVRKIRTTRRVLARNALFLLLYAIVLALALWRSGIHPPPRYLLPMYVPGVLIVALVLQAHCHHIARALARVRRERTATRAARWEWSNARLFRPSFIGSVLVVVAFLCWQGLRVPALVQAKYEYMRNSCTIGRGMGSKLWRDSETLAYVKEHVPIGARILTNRTSVLIWHVAPFSGLSARFHDVSRYSRPAPSTYLVWFHNGSVRYPRWINACEEQPRLDHFIETTGLRVVAALTDGIVFQFGRPGEGDSAPAIRAAAVAGLVGDAQTVYQSNAVGVHLAAGRVIYTVHSKDCPCGAFPFQLQVTPAAPAGPDAPRSLDLTHMFQESWWYVIAACAAVVDLPDYELAALKTGHIRAADGAPTGEAWSVEAQLR